MIKRIFLLLSIPVVTLPTYASDIKPVPDQWDVAVIKDEFTDQQQTFAFVASTEGKEKGVIVVACFARGQIETKISTGAYIGSKDIPNNMLYRVDDDPAVTSTMTPSKRVVFSDKYSEQFLQDIKQNYKDHVNVQLTDFEFNTTKAKFTLKNASESIKKVVDACGM